jgi:hypothetical protein
MPSGVYERKPYMASFGRLHGQRDYIVSLREQGHGWREIGKQYGVSKQAVMRAVSGDWNPGRARGRAA